MKQFLMSDTKLYELTQEIQTYSDKIETPRSNNTLLIPKEEAALIIQHGWRNVKIKANLKKNPYDSYLSMMDSTDDQFQLSRLMYGRHVAEIRLGAKERIDNPLINTREFYHRSQPLSNPVFNRLINEFNITDSDLKNNVYIPVTLLKNNPIEHVVGYFKHLIPYLKLIKKEGYTIALLAVPVTNNEALYKLREKIKNMGLVASSWEISENIKSKLDESKNSTIKCSLRSDLPTTKDSLFKSKIMATLVMTATNNGHYPTQLLAKCLLRLLNNLPPNINPQAIQRMATMLDITNTFYRMNYPRYAVCVYSILHEISLALLNNKDSSFLEQEYNDFQTESEITLSKALDLYSSKVKNSTFIAAATTSGASACAIAMRIISTMNTIDGTKPKVKIFIPCYYELPNTFNLDSTEDANKADILMISAGPIVNPEGLTPGIDINHFVRRHIINTGRTKPVSIVIDATTALYKNIHLSDDVKKLVEEGALSILIHESHQKFGLLHSDQAQYGKVFGWCSNKQFSKKSLDKIKNNSMHDFYTHIDIRIGSFISSHCKELLERIKQQHFSNGAILRNILLNTSLIHRDIVFHNDMMNNHNELYFLNDDEIQPNSYTSRLERAAFGVIDYRASFGHYTMTSTGVMNQRRLSPDASDNLDALIQASHIRISQILTPHKAIGLIGKVGGNKDQLTLEEQIVMTGIVHYIITNTSLIPQTFEKVRLITSSPSEEDIKQVIASNKNTHDILFINIPGQKIRLAYCSHDHQFRSREINDPKITALINSKTITEPKNYGYIRSYLNSLQKSTLPSETNFAFIYAGLTQVIRGCSMLKNRPSTLNIHAYLNALKERIVIQYKPLKEKAFLEVIVAMKAQGIPLKDSELQFLGQHPELYHVIKESTNRSKTKAFLALSVSMNTPINDTNLFKNKHFIAAIEKIDKSNNTILEGLINSPKKHKEATEASKKYLNACFKALYDFYNTSNPDESCRKQLIQSITSAEHDYLKVLSKDRSSLSQTARYILKAVTNFIAALTLGLAHYINYKTTGSVMFFSGTRSEGQLKKANKDLIEEIEHIGLGTF